MENKKSKEVKAKDGASMVAPHPHAGKDGKGALKSGGSDLVDSGKKAKEPGSTDEEDDETKLFPVEEIAKKKGVKSWETAGLVQAVGWLPGKQVTAGEFDLALSRFRKRPQGGGRI